MSKKQRPVRPKARLPKGLADNGAEDIRAMAGMLDTIRAVFERYGFAPLDTPAMEYSDALGKFLPDQDRPNEGVFSLEDDDGQWLSLRYDLTAPLARYVAQNFNELPKPFRRYQVGPVWRNEKPGPGRFRQFMQFDADTVGAPSVAADAEMCMLAADTLEALGIPRGQYVIRVNNRKVLDGVLESIGVDPHDTSHLGKRLTILRALDKYDRLGDRGVKQILGKGRWDGGEEGKGDFTKGAGLRGDQVDELMSLLEFKGLEELIGKSCVFVVDRLIKSRFSIHSSFLEGAQELGTIAELVEKSGYATDRIVIDPSVVRGLDYYTGPVFEAELTFPVKSAEGGRFGSVGGGGRYDDLVARFTGQKVPATGISIGVSRLAAALRTLGKLEDSRASGPVVVTVFDKERMADYQRMVQTLREADIAAELYLGNPKNMGAQFKYADQRGSPCVVIQGPDEKAKGEVQIKDLIEGAKAAQTIATHEEWKSERPAQFAVAESKLVEAVRDVLARHKD